MPLVIETVERTVVTPAGTRTFRDISNPPRLISGRAATLQRAIERLLFHRGEWLLNVDEGIPYLGDILGRDPDLVHQKILGELRKGGTPATDLVLRLDQDTRELTVNVTLEGQRVTATVAL